mmetsp:Transcript_24629/g.21803  ORF Transcript_24629/g.21803 Transcript_24629/m.21803 type:complete len:89 (+) Transcript_24629:1731-1997(+)
MSDGRIMVLQDAIFYIVDLVFGNVTTYRMGVQWGFFSWTLDEYQRKYFFFSEDNGSSPNDMPVIIDQYGLREVDYSIRGHTLEAAGAG